MMTTDPERVRSSRMVENVFPRAKIVYKVTTQRDFAQTLDALFRRRRRERHGLASRSATCSRAWTTRRKPARSARDDVSAAADNELVKLVNKIIVDAYNQGASDIHIEPLPGKGKTEHPLPQGRLAAATTSRCRPRYRNALVTRLKIMCDLDISEKRKPQDGKIKFKKFGPLDIELRVATIPTAGGVEDVVMRILAAGEPIPLDKLGLSAAQPRDAEGLRLQALRPVLRLRPDRLRQDDHAALGAGLPQHAGHQDLDRRGPGRNHAEGPAPGADEPEGGARPSPSAMKAFLRADPDIIMVGEMRDKETTVDRHRGLAHRPPGVRHAAHQQRAGIDHPPARHGHGPVQLRRRAARHPRAAPGQAPVQVQGAVHARRRTRSSTSSTEYCEELQQHRRVQEGPERRLQERLRPLPEGLRLRQARVHACTRPRAATPAAAPATRAGSACTSCWSAPTR